MTLEQYFNAPLRVRYHFLTYQYLLVQLIYVSQHIERDQLSQKIKILFAVS